MIRIEVELSEPLVDWARQTATQYGLSLDAYIELLIGLESGLAQTSRDGRQLRARSFSYRGSEMYFVPSQSAHAERR